MLTELHISCLDQTELSDWIADREHNAAILPLRTNCSLLWLAIDGDKVIRTECFYPSSGPRVIIANYIKTKALPCDIYPYIFSDLLQARANGESCHLIVTGFSRHRNLQLWLDEKKSICRGELPLFRLTVMLFINIILSNKPRVHGLLKKLRGK